MKRVFLTAALSLSLLFPTLSVAKERFIIDYFNNFKTLEADFNQIVKSKQSSETSSGHLKLQKPEGESLKPKFVFDYKKPYAQLLMSNGEKLWHYDVDLMQVVIKPTKELENNPLLMVLLGDRTLDQSFTIQTVSNGQSYILFPKNPQDGLEILSIDVNFKGKKLHSFVAKDLTGQTVTFELQRVQENRPLEASSFEFRAPKDVDVIDETR